MKHLLVLLLLLCATTVSAQDVIVKKDGSTILSKVLEVGQAEIKYKRFDNIDGPTYTIKKSEIQAINYQNGAKDTFSTPVREENRYLPNNQNDGTQAMIDRALVELDNSIHKPILRKVRTLQITGGVLGGIMVGIGTYLVADAHNHGEHSVRRQNRGMGIALIGGGAAIGTTLFLIANKVKKDNLLQSTVIYQHNINLTNGASISAGVDLINDRLTEYNTLGLGLRYNF